MGCDVRQVREMEIEQSSHRKFGSGSGSIGGGGSLNKGNGASGTADNSMGKSTYLDFYIT